MNGPPTIVCLCFSTRFYREYQIANFDETLAGNIVLSVGFYPHPKEHHEQVGLTNAGYDERVKKALDELHKRKIDLADEVLVICPGGYVGDSTRGKIEYAEALGKPVRYRQDFSALAPSSPPQAGATAGWLEAMETARTNFASNPSSPVEPEATTETCGVVSMKVPEAPLTCTRRPQHKGDHYDKNVMLSWASPVEGEPVGYRWRYNKADWILSELSPVWYDKYKDHPLYEIEKVYTLPAVESEPGKKLHPVDWAEFMENAPDLPEDPLPTVVEGEGARAALVREKVEAALREGLENTQQLIRLSKSKMPPPPGAEPDYTIGAARINGALAALASQAREDYEEGERDV